MKDKDGVVRMEKSDVLGRWRKFFSQLLKMEKDGRASITGRTFLGLWESITGRTFPGLRGRIEEKKTVGRCESLQKMTTGKTQTADESVTRRRRSTGDRQ